MRTKVLCLAATVLSLAGMPRASAQGDRFILSKAVPADCWLYIHKAANPEREFLNKHWSQVFEALKAVHIDRDIRSMVNSQMETDEQRAEFNTHWDKAIEQCTNIKWSDLFGNEVAFFQRFMPPVPENTVLLAPKKETLDANVKGLVAMMEQLAALDESLSVVTSEQGGAKVWTLSAGPIPVSLNLFHRDTVVGMSTSPAMVTEVIAMLSGEGKSAALTSGERFRKAIGDLPKPEDSVSFVDLARLWSSFGGMVAAHEQQGAPGEDIQMVRKVLNELDFIDYIAATEQTEGLKTVSHAVTRISEGGKTKKLCRVLADRPPLDGFLKHVPQDANGFYAWTGADLDGLYQFVQHFVSTNFPAGPQWIASWNEWQNRVNFDVQRDVLDWLDGQLISVTFGAAAAGGMSPGESVMMVKVRDKDKAMAALDGQLKRLGENVSVGQASGINADGFKTVAHPMLMMMGVGQFLYGVQDGWLYVSNTTAAVNKCLASAKGEAPSFAKNPRFQSEGVLPSGPVSSASFTDTSTWGQQAAMMLGMMPMGAAMIPPSPEADQIRTLLMIIGKLAPVAAEVDFIRSASSVTTFKGDHWRVQTVTTYSEYTPPAPKRAAPEKKSDSALEGL